MTEATANLIGYLVSGMSAVTSDATAHYGGAWNVITNALRHRHRLQGSFKQRKLGVAHECYKRPDLGYENYPAAPLLVPRGFSF